MQWETNKFFGVEVTTKLSYYPRLVANRYRVTLDTNIRVPISRTLTWGVLIYDRFDSQPLPEVKRNDYGIIGTLGVGL